MEEENILEPEKPVSPVIIWFGKIFRILFFLGILGLIWTIFPFATHGVSLESIATLIGTIAASFAVIYGMISPDPQGYETWGRFGIIIVLGIFALYLLSFLF